MIVWEPTTSNRRYPSVTECSMVFLAIYQIFIKYTMMMVFFLDFTTFRYNKDILCCLYCFKWKSHAIRVFNKPGACTLRVHRNTFWSSITSEKKVVYFQMVRKTNRTKSRLYSQRFTYVIYADDKFINCNCNRETRENRLRFYGLRAYFELNETFGIVFILCVLKM